jgi:Ulp1 family protease
MWMRLIKTTEARELNLKEWMHIKEQSNNVVKHWLEDLEPVISQSRYLFVPLNYRNHWHLLVVDITEKKIMHYDPAFIRPTIYERRAVQAVSDFVT